MESLPKLLNLFAPISLKEMDAVSLLNRTDTKFVLNTNTFEKSLPTLVEYYRILEIDNKRTNDYKTLYYDTPKKDLFVKHHNGKKNRYKLRFRKYLDSGLCFLEIKFKNNKGRTIKSRSKIKEIEQELSLESGQFIQDSSELDFKNLKPSLWNSFTRLTLVHKTNKERLTIDLNLQFETIKGDIKSMENTIIAEVKREGLKAHSDFIDIMKQNRISPFSISKYCIGTALIDNNIKSNRFKPTLRTLKKISNGELH